jgi:hypothetical protein
MPDPIASEQDDQAVIAIAENSIHHANIEHIEIKNYYIRENIEKKLMKLIYCPTEYIFTDLLTKALPTPQHLKLCEITGLCSMSKLESGLEKNVRLKTKFD